MVHVLALNYSTLTPSWKTKRERKIGEVWGAELGGDGCGGGGGDREEDGGGGGDGERKERLILEVMVVIERW